MKKAFQSSIILLMLGTEVLDAAILFNEIFLLI
jgi:hypothetical protein